MILIVFFSWISKYYIIISTFTYILICNYVITIFVTINYFIIFAATFISISYRVIPCITFYIVFIHKFKLWSVIFSRIICSITVRIRCKIINYRLRITISCSNGRRSHARGNRIDCIYSTITLTDIFIVAYS